MAKKGNAGFDTADKAAARLPGGTAELPSTPVTQPATRKRDSVAVPEQTAAASPAQVESAMIQQILERQAVFGF